MDVRHLCNPICVVVKGLVWWVIISPPINSRLSIKSNSACTPLTLPTMSDPLPPELKLSIQKMCVDSSRRLFQGCNELLTTRLACTLIGFVIATTFVVSPSEHVHLDELLQALRWGLFPLDRRHLQSWHRSLYGSDLHLLQSVQTW